LRNKILVKLPHQ